MTTIKITSDFICPWCLVAEIRLNQAIAKLNTNLEIKRIWYPYELNPTMPEAGIERKVYRTKKFGSWEYSQQLDAKTVQATQNDGINFRYDLMAKTPNTLKAHRLTWLAASFDKATEMATRILNAYFTEGKDITDIDTLVKLAADVGTFTQGVNVLDVLLDATVSEAYLNATVEVLNRTMTPEQAVDSIRKVALEVQAKAAS